MNKYLLTFPTTTAAFGAEKILKESGYDAQVDAVPFELSKTCYGLGVVFHGDDHALVCQNPDIKWKRCWLSGDDGYALVAENHK